jgi:hypothetical protein
MRALVDIARAGAGEAGPRDPDLAAAVHHACAALAALARHAEPRAALMRLGGADVLLRVAAAARAPARLQAALGVARLAQDRANQEGLVGMGALRPLVQLAAQTLFETLQAEGLRALRALGNNPEVRGRVMDALAEAVEEEGGGGEGGGAGDVAGLEEALPLEARLRALMTALSFSGSGGASGSAGGKASLRTATDSASLNSNDSGTGGGCDGGGGGRDGGGGDGGGCDGCGDGRADALGRALLERLVGGDGVAALSSSVHRRALLPAGGAAGDAMPVAVKARPRSGPIPSPPWPHPTPPSPRAAPASRPCRRGARRLWRSTSVGRSARGCSRRSRATTRAARARARRAPRTPTSSASSVPTMTRAPRCAAARPVTAALRAPGRAPQSRESTPAHASRTC